ncbi:MAG: motility associated factor glycosyltransferase family protein [Tepidisphaerales bacterium]
MPILADPSSRYVMAEPEPLLSNMAALWRVDSVLAMALEPLLDAQAYPTEASKSGESTLALSTADGRRIYLHSRHQPLAEAQRLVSGEELAEKGIYAVHGFGLGYHVQALFDRMGDASVILVLEPDLKLIRTALALRDYSKMFRTGRVLFLTEPQRGPLLSKLGPHQSLVTVGLEIVAHAPSLQLAPEFQQQFQTWLAEYADYCRTGMRTLLLNSRRTCENLSRNIGWYAAAGDIRRLRDRHAGQPAIIVSAGPSLRKNKHLLHQAVGKAVIIAVQTTLQPLVEMGIEPHYATSLDYHDICTRFFEKLPKQLRTELVAEPKASAAVFGLYPGPISLIGCDYSEKLLREMHLSRDRVRSGATVAHLAFYLAEWVGCDPIIFVGQDLGFSDGLCYAPGTSYEDVWRPELGRFCTMEMRQWEQIVRERPILRKIEDWQGRPMYTEERLFTYLQQFERDFAATSRTVIDATEGGARKRGITAMTLAEALQRYCCQPIPPAASDHPGLRWQTLAGVRVCLDNRRREAKRIAEIGRSTLPLLEEVRDHLDDDMRVNRAIARIDQLRSEMFELNHAYELATQLSQQTELERFKRDFAISASKAQGTERQRRQTERDIENVNAIIAAAQGLEKMMDEVLRELPVDSCQLPVDSADPRSQISNLKSEIPNSNSEIANRKSQIANPQ